MAVAHRLAFLSLQGYQRGDYEDPRFPELLIALAHRGSQNPRLKALYETVAKDLGLRPA